MLKRQHTNILTPFNALGLIIMLSAAQFGGRRVSIEVVGAYCSARGATQCPGVCALHIHLCACNRRVCWLHWV
jgi:hypothetical protein